MCFLFISYDQLFVIYITKNAFRCFANIPVHKYLLDISHATGFSPEISSSHSNVYKPFLNYGSFEKRMLVKSEDRINETFFGTKYIL